MKIELIEHQVFMNGEEKNTQSIKEALMREACKQCDAYCTDLLIFFDNSWKSLIKGEITEIALYFRQMGVEWNDFYENNRSIAILTRDMAKNTLKLIIDYGNV